jgi:hypothetical protein
MVGIFCIKVFNIFTDFLNSRRVCGGRVFFVLIVRYPSTYGGVFFVLRYLIFFTDFLNSRRSCGGRVFFYRYSFYLLYFLSIIPAG